MVIPTELLHETEQRYQERREARKENREKIAAGEVLGANAAGLVQKRLERLARAEATTAGLSADSAAAAAVPGAPLETSDTLGTALERLIGKSDLISVNYLELGMAVSRTVGRIHARSATGRTQSYGTGFMVSPRLVLTNNHVLGSVREASNSWIEFNFQDDTEGRLLASVLFNLAPQTFFLTDRRLDYSLVAVGETSRDSNFTLDQFGWNRLIEEQGKAIVGEHVNIVQHPNGEPKQLALRENQIVDELEDFLHYETDTAPGSSGSPVFNDQWEVIALHHSGVPKKDDGGRILTRDDTVWTPDMGEHRIAWLANEGARVSRIVRHLKQQSLSSTAQRGLRNALFESTPSPSPLPARGPGEPAARSVGVGDTVNPSIGQDGSVIWTLPLQVSVRLGQQPVSTTAPVSAPAVQPSTGIGGGASAGVGTDPPSDRGENPEEVGDGGEELREALEELAAARSRPYYDEETDRQSREAYYENLPDSPNEAELFRALSDLLLQTHTTKPKYEPTKHVYPWVDLRPNLQLSSIYSGRDLDPEEVIREDLRIDQQRVAQLQEMISNESTLGAERIAQELDGLEASLPFNCEHVVPQSYYDKREPMRGDLHHLFACEPDCNSFRGNIPYFDFPDFEEAVRGDCGRREANKFEPTAGKGAVARATLYFLLRYPGEINHTEREYEPERIETLLNWHEAEPVEDYERHRNAAIFEKQGNRNPLIDHPEWATEIDFTLGFGAG